MTIEESRLELAARVAARSVPGGEKGSVTDRLAAFEVAHRAVSGLEAADDEWMAATLSVAWDLVRDVDPAGTPVERLTADLSAAHRVVVAAGRPPVPPQRKRPRRDS